VDYETSGFLNPRPARTFIVHDRRDCAWEKGTMNQAYVKKKVTSMHYLLSTTRVHTRTETSCPAQPLPASVFTINELRRHRLRDTASRPTATMPRYSVTHFVHSCSMNGVRTYSWRICRTCTRLWIRAKQQTEATLLAVRCSYPTICPSIC
jgi:hypothetical protein